MSKPVYRFTLDTGTVQREVFPRFENVTLDVEQESEQYYYREKISGRFIFQRGDYDFIASKTIETEFEFLIEERIAGTWETFFTGYFTRTDCDIDEDNRTVILQPNSRDNYENFLSKLDKEFDLIQLAPVSTPVNYKIRGILQVFVLNQTYLTNYVGGSWWETPVLDPAITPTNLITDFNFLACATIVFIPSANPALSPNVAGVYDPDTLTNGRYIIQQDFVTPDTDTWFWRIYDQLDGVTVYESEGDLAFEVGYDEVTFTSLTDPLSTCYIARDEIYARVLTNELNVDGDATELIPENDIVAANPNYTRCIGIQFDNFVGSDLSQETPGAFGRFADGSPGEGSYFAQLFDPAVDVTSAYPVNPSSWRDHSIWMWYDTALETILFDAETPNVLTVAYHIADVIAAILAQVAPEISHLRSNLYSFLYAATNIIRGEEKYPLITPKSNFITARYDQPASRAKIKLSEILELVRIFHNAYPIIDSSDRLLIEHTVWHDNGGAYETQIIGTNLTALIEPKTAKNWSYGTSKYKYEKEQMPEEITFKWMDSDVSSAFAGYPIGVRSRYVQKGNKRDENIARFTSDVDYIVGNPSVINPDGFVFMEAVGEGVGGDLELPVVNITLPSGLQYNLQNGYAAFIYAHEQYHRHGLPAQFVTINEADATASFVKRRKVQEITYPAGVQPNPVQLIRTLLGDGKIQKVSYNLSTREAKLTIRHDTE